MRVLLILSFFSIYMSSCSQNKVKNHIEPAASNYYSNNEDKFGFLIFDSKNVDSFFSQYNQLNSSSQELTNAFKVLAETAQSKTNADIEKKFAKHTHKPSNTDFELASKLLNSSTKDNSKKYFFSNLLYLFFYQSLPKELQYKWAQGLSGDFEFNVTFFNLLRTHCKTFDDHIYGSEGLWDENIRKVFGEFIVNEITAQKAIEIKQCLQQADAFRDARIQVDKEHFVEFLDKVVAGKWRLFLYDKN